MQSRKIHLVEVGPRDGLQNEKKILSTEQKAKLIDLLTPCGFREIEVGSFVSPKWVPQMANTAEVYKTINKDKNVFYSVLIPNMYGLQEALTANVQDVSIFTAASEDFNLKNINCTIEESFQRFEPVMKSAKKNGLRVRGYISCVVSCPYSGDVAPEKVRFVADRLWKMGCREISLGDTIGRGNPISISTMIQEVSKDVPISALAIHCHDTYGIALDNIEAALTLGIRVVDSALNGLGGCPYGGKKAKGNVATQSVLKKLSSLGYETSIDEEKMNKAAQWLTLEMA